MNEETLKDIAAEMRRHESGKVDVMWYDREKWRELCDRIDAKIKELRDIARACHGSALETSHRIGDRIQKVIGPVWEEGEGPR